MLNALRALLVSTLVSGVLVQHASAERISPDVMVKQAVEDVLRILRTDKQVQAGEVEHIARVMEEKVAPHFDFPRMTRLAVGRSWREASQEQRDALIGEFRTLLVRSYSAAFTFYKGIAVEYRPFRGDSNADEATVSTLIRLPGGAQPISVDYDLAASDASWKVFDVRVDGASLVINYRNVFGQEIQRGGIDGLLKSLKEKNAAKVAAGTKQP